MHLLVCFDVSDDKARRRLVKCLLGHGERVQYSVFEIRLKQGEFNHLTKRVAKIIASSDKIHYMPLCGKDLARRQTDGIGHIYHPASYYTIS